MRTFVIAEAGANHNRDWRIAKKLIYTAAASGASAVKFQNYTSHGLYTKNTPDFGNYKNIPKLISSIELPKEWCKELKSICDDCGIEFMSTPFDEESVELLFNIGVKRLKIASFEATDTRLVSVVASTKLPVIFSAGIGTGVDKVKNIIDRIKNINPQCLITVLHCNSSYPTPYSDINLGQMNKLIRELDDKIQIGLSDHTEGILIPPIAVTHGATVIEKHFTLDKKSPGPDHAFAIEPQELFTMCKHIEIAEQSMGSKNDNDLTESEEKNEMFFALRSVVAKRKIKSGEILSRDNITTKRPYLVGNISAEKYSDVLGNYICLSDIEEDSMILESQIEKVKND